MEQAAVVRQIAQELNGGSRSGRSMCLARLMAASVATVRSRGASGSSQERKRVMTSTARRLLFVLLALQREATIWMRSERRRVALSATILKMRIDGAQEAAHAD